jgi:hypothetical protein
MQWIRKDYDSPTHEVATERERVYENGEWSFRAKTLCGRTITGRSGGTAFRVDCLACRRVGDALDKKET